MAETAELLDDAWVQKLVEASAGLELVEGRSAVVAFTVGKKKQAVVEISDGRVAGPGDPEAVAVTVPLTAAQFDGFVDRSQSFARDYMMGDLKPVGSTGALLAVLELFENPRFLERL